MLLQFMVPDSIFSTHPHTFVHFLSTFSILMTLASLTVILLMAQRDWAGHHIVRNLRQFNPDWHSIAEEINQQVREPLVYSIQYNAYSRVLVTVGWIIRISNYSVELARVEDSRLIVVDSNQHPLLSNENNGLQMIDIRVESVSRTSKPFIIR